jgi:hypothetical protein
MELSPAAPIGMAIGADVAPVDPAVVGTRDLRAKVARAIDLAARWVPAVETPLLAHITRTRACA